MIHLVDIYIHDNPEENLFVWQKINEYLNPFHIKLFKPYGEIPNYRTPSDIIFSCSYVTNPDNAMHSWNRISPALKEKREQSQSCTLLIMGNKS